MVEPQKSSVRRIILPICLNNISVSAFEKGDLQRTKQELKKALAAFKGHSPLEVFSSGEDGDCRHSSLSLIQQLCNFSSNKSFLKHLGNQRLEICESNIFGTTKRKRKPSSQKHRVKRALAMQEQATSPSFIYQKMFLIKTSPNVLTEEQITNEQVSFVILFNLALCYHLKGTLLGTSSKFTKKAVKLYDRAFEAAIMCKDPFFQLVVLNNLSQIFAHVLSQFDIAEAYFKQLRAKVNSDGDMNVLLDRLNSEDRLGLLLNLALSNPRIAAAA